MIKKKLIFRRKYEIYNSSNEKITEAKTTLFFLDAKKNKVVKCPDFLMDLLVKSWAEPA